MPDTLPALSPQVEACDGFVVVSRKLSKCLPPYRYAYSYDEFGTFRQAHEHAADLQRDEYPGWEYVGIFAAHKGMPMGDAQ